MTDLSGLHGAPSALYLVGDVRERLAGLPDASVDLVLTSPPFLALRSYLPADHPDKALEMGSESTPGAFIDTLLDVVEECRRVLAPHGTLAFELGDTYSGSGGAGGDYNEGGLRDGQEKFDGSGLRSRGGRADRSADVAAGLTQARRRPGPEGRDSIDGYPQDKSLCLIPESFRWALAYGRNPFTGRTTEPWRVRNVVRWHRPNPPVGALGDKFRPATSDLVIACTSRTRWFDLDAVRTPAQVLMGRNVPGNNTKGCDDQSFRFSERVDPNPAGAPPLDTWVIPTEPYPGSHYATWPAAFLTRPILAMCPRQVCRVCGEPRRRTFAENPNYDGRAGGPTNNNAQQGASLKGFAHVAYPPTRWQPDGWTSCGHDDMRPGIVLDPFAGSGTTLAVATGHGRSALGIDLDARNAELARERVGMFLTVEGDGRPRTQDVTGGLAL
jgi:hypothetical protein